MRVDIGGETALPEILECWKDRVAVVTGASSGIGRQIALDLVRSGMRVAGIARRAERLRETRDALGELGGRFHPYRCDLGNHGEIPGVFALIEEQLGPPAVLVNNAGAGYDEPILSGNISRWREMIDLNVLALCACTQEAASRMVKDEAIGYIINISSLSGHRVHSAEGVFYAATKHAARAVAEGLRRELHGTRRPVRVSSISPGLVDTEFIANYHQGRQGDSFLTTDSPCLTPADISRAVVFLLSQPLHVQIQDILLRPREQLV